MQIALVNTDTGRMQTLEAGWQERKDSYGDWFPHLFLFYTTNGYTDEGDNEGGYNQDVDGWVQYDGSVHPGAISSPNSTRGGDQYVMQIKYQLFQNNWWFMCNGRWLGYYPASLFMGNRSVFSTLGDHAESIAFYGRSTIPMKCPVRSIGHGQRLLAGIRLAVGGVSAQPQGADRSRRRVVELRRRGWASDPDMYHLEGNG